VSRCDLLPASPAGMLEGVAKDALRRLPRDPFDGPGLIRSLHLFPADVDILGHFPHDHHVQRRNGDSTPSKLRMGLTLAKTPHSRRSALFTLGYVFRYPRGGWSLARFASARAAAP